MQQLSQADCATLLTLASELYVIEPGDALPQRLLHSLQSLIPYEFGGCHWIQPSTRQITARYAPERPPFPAQHKEFWRLAATHPLNPLLFANSARVWKLSDVISRRAFHQTEFYNVLYRPLQVDCELTGTFPDPAKPGVFLLISLHRSCSDFTERDRALLNLLLPHVAKARARLNTSGRFAPNGHWWFCDEETFYEWVSQHTPWGLSRRESEVLFWLCQGKTNSEIGSILGIAGRTAETHALNIYPKMGVENRYTAIATLTQLAAARQSFAGRG
jgi:DNA-binding CsgD family transcriptional regulator